MVKAAAWVLSIAIPWAAGAMAREKGLPAALASGSPALKTDTAVYHMQSGTLQYAFTFVNPTDSVVFLDCQVPPFAALSGDALVLTFDRTAFTATDAGGGGHPDGALPSPAGGGGHGVSSSGTGRPSAPAGPGVLAGGPLGGGAVDPDAFPPQRVGPHQAFQGQRKLDRVLGDAHARPAFSKVLLRMAWYPERAEGEGAHYLVAGKTPVSAAPRNVMRKGKAPPRPQAARQRAPVSRETQE